MKISQPIARINFFTFITSHYNLGKNEKNGEKLSPAYNKEEITITNFSSDGKAVGKLSDGRVVFVPGTIPGERVLIRYSKSDKRYVQAELIEILSYSPKRTSSRCRYFGTCAHCRLQHLNYFDQTEVKRNILIDQLKRIGKMGHPESLIQPTIPSDPYYGYRKNMIFSVLPDGKLGLQDVSGGMFVADRCPICSEGINELIRQISFEAESGIHAAEFREGVEGELQIVLRGDADRPPMEIETDLSVSLVYSGPVGSFVLSGNSTLVQEIAGQEICASEDSPFFPNPEIYDALCQKLIEILPEDRDKPVLNLNCGTGFWAKWFASQGRKVIAQDVGERSADDFAVNLDAFDSVDLYLGKPELIIPAFRENKPLTVFEAASEGISVATAQALSKAEVPRILYISHDSAILARDTIRLSDSGYKLNAIIPFDDEPQTAIISAAAIFRKNR